MNPFYAQDALLILFLVLTLCFVVLNWDGRHGRG